VQLEKIKASRGTSVDDGTATESLKPLVEVLREAKEKKEADFQAMWKQMKTGQGPMHLQRGCRVLWAMPAVVPQPFVICMCVPCMHRQEPALG
jgi:hypothetical protein